MLLAGGPAFAEEAYAADGQEEILVTATRQGEVRLQDVPMSISVIDTEAMERSGEDGLQSLAHRAASIMIQEDTPGINRIDMRGLVTAGVAGDSADISVRSMVGVYLDESSIAQFGGNPDLRVFDLERIEVLKGPQGTQFGAGAMSGTIRYITQKPDTNRFFGSAEGTLSTTRHGGTNYSVRGMTNIPIIADTLAFRGAIYKGEDSGFIDSIGMYNGVVAKNINETRNFQLRGAVRWYVTPDLVTDFSWTHARLEADGRNKGYSGLKPYQTSILVPEGSSSDFDLFNNTTRWDVGPVTLSSSTSFLKRKFTYTDSQESYPANYTGVLLPATFDSINKTETWTQEFRLSSSAPGPLQYNFGVYYEKLTRDFWEDIWAQDISELLVDAGYRSAGYSALYDGGFYKDSFFSATQAINESQIAIYGEVTYSPVESLDLTAGVRYFDWHQKFDLYFGAFTGVLEAGTPSVKNDSTSESGFNPRFRVSYKANDDLLFFAEASKGFRFGGVNQPVPPDLCASGMAQEGITETPSDFGADSLWSYSVGNKASFAGGRATANFTAFYIKWSDVQTKRLIPVCWYSFAENAGEVVSKGLEFDGSTRLFDGFNLSANASYTNAKSKGSIVNLTANSGDPAPFFPKWIVGAGVDYTTPLGAGSLLFEANWQVRSGFWNVFNHELSSARKTPSQDFLSASINYSLGNFEIGLFGTNLSGGTKYILRDLSYREAFYPGDSYNFYARPRTIGARVKASF
ncbi:TonB-dependent receptor [Novosphingobium album (ex Liu et al. 2023)]|uniref:TonB-dependent receptor n=1 Tax=Novosphingobium album (ex Liu et al. 2023) TaxID=3031130 RepID=A0ABT5WXH5_9SPHN|nr:TonB-dependent receptor [Novosphingobium album (ex Liu et al. 2023)]MDE8654597.1 TonB-dependent receptor [Novosphingobium album (ex Liu et al. 2023)]